METMMFLPVIFLPIKLPNTLGAFLRFYLFDNGAAGYKALMRPGI